MMEEGLMGCIDLSAAVDVYSEWVDACDAVAKADGGDMGGGGDAPLRAPASMRNGGRGRADEREEDIDDLIDDEDDQGYGHGDDGIAADDEY